jgi:hypothetical protein
MGPSSKRPSGVSGDGFKLHPRIRHIERGAYNERDGDAFALNKMARKNRYH